MAAHLTLYNTLTRSKDPVVPADPGNITFYTCGPTVYDDAHIGNFRAFLAADLLRRWLESPLCTLLDKDGNEHHGPRTVRHILNITDVGHMTDDDSADGGGEDKMQLAAERLLEQKKAGTAHAEIDNPNDPRQIAAFYTKRFLEDARKLGLKVAIEAEKDPSLMPRASDNVEGMKRMIETLADKGFAYRVDDAVYFDVQQYKAYGELSGNTLDHLRGGAGGRVSSSNQSAKRHPADFLLWKSDSAHLMKWPGPVIAGVAMPEGYPGWHIECSVMAQAALGDEIDIHSGGEDNIFPHHECERAQSCCANDTTTFARHWLHARFLMVEGEKMSKSKGNFFTVRSLLDKNKSITPAAVRLELIKTHYRTNANFTHEGLRESAGFLDRVRTFAAFVKGVDDGKCQDISAGLMPMASQALAEFTSAMNSDLNVSKALAALSTLKFFGGTRAIGQSWAPEFVGFSTDDLPTHALDAVTASEMVRNGRSAYAKAYGALHLIDNVLGVIFTPQPKQTETDIGLFTGGLEPDPAVIDMLIARRDAKKAKDFAESDRIRDELASMGYAIKDVAGGKVEVSRA